MNNNLWTVKWGLLQLTSKNQEEPQPQITWFDYDQSECPVVQSSRVPSGDYTELYFKYISLLENRNEVIRIGNPSSNTITKNDSGELIFAVPLWIEISAKKLFDVVGSNKRNPGNLDSDYSIYLIYDGFFYMLYWVKRGQNNSDVAHLVKEWLELLLHVSEDFSSYEVPPSPFNESLLLKFYIEKNLDQYHIKSKDQNRSIEIVNVELPETKDVHDFFVYLHSDIWNDFFGYFCFLHFKNKLSKLQNEIKCYYRDLIACSHEYQLLSLYRLYKHKKLKRDMRSLIISLFSLYAEYNISYSYYQTEKNNIMKQFPDNDYLEFHSDELKRILILEQDSFQTIQSLIEYSKDLVASNEGYYNNIISAIIGATVGGIIVYLIG